MTAQPVLLDTDVLSAIMRRHPQATARARFYLLEHRRFTFSAITRYALATNNSTHFSRIAGLAIENWLLAD